MKPPRLLLIVDSLLMDNARPAVIAPRRVHLGKGAQVWVAGDGEREASAKAERVLLLHGWGLRPEVFLPSVRHLAGRGFEVAAPGLAVVGRKWDMDRAVHRVNRTLEELEWDEAIVVGYSLGGAIATSLAASHPEHVRMLVLVNSVGLRIDRSMAGWATGFTRYARTGNLKAIRAFGVNALRIGGLQNLAAAGRYARFAALDEELARVRDHSIPSIVLWGVDDRLLPAALGRDIAAMIDAPFHLIPGADHDWPVIDPALFAREIDHLLRSNPVVKKRRLSGRRPKRAARRGTQ
jgi:pimeloyl-ACP methyl ester carboxylesterase